MYPVNLCAYGMQSPRTKYYTVLVTGYGPASAENLVKRFLTLRSTSFHSKEMFLKCLKVVCCSVLLLLLNCRMYIYLLARK